MEKLNFWLQSKEQHLFEIKMIKKKLTDPKLLYGSVY